MTAYCVKCGRKVEIQNPKEVKIGDRPTIQGKCGKCGTKVTRFVASKEKIKEAVKEALEKDFPPGQTKDGEKTKQDRTGRDLCICNKCGQVHKHIRGVPCADLYCSKCGEKLAPFSHSITE